MSGVLLPFFGSVAGRQGQPSPDELPSLNLWYNASSNSTDLGGVSTDNFSTAVVNGTSVSAWTDLSGTGHDANVTGGGGPQPNYATNICNGLGMVQYTSANSDNLDINPTSWINNLSGLTIYVLARPTNYAAQFPLASSQQSSGISYDGTNMQVGVDGVFGTTSAFNKDTNECHIFGMVFDGSQTATDTITQNYERLKFRINGIEQILTFSGTVGSTTGSLDSYLFFGGENRPGMTLGFMDGYIGEVMIFTRALNFAEQLGVESYLRQKWGTSSPTVTIESFTSIGSTSWTAPANVNLVEYLVVGGGGGGGNAYDNAGGGGGGGGMVLTGTLSVTPNQSYAVTVGDGGSGGINQRANHKGASGNDSIFSSITAFGGGPGGGSRTGGSPGVAQVSNVSAATGGNGNGGGLCGDGGGGATGNGTENTSSGGVGGNGTGSPITGVMRPYSWGGSGGCNTGPTNGLAGLQNHGAGGGGGSSPSFNSASGGKGGSGIVILRYLQ